VRDDLTGGRIKAARAIAMVADLLQIGLFPLFMEGGLSIANDVVDFSVAVLMVWLLGFHWAFLPSLVAELVPGLNLVPTWTAAVLFATRGGPGLPEAKAEVIEVPGAPRSLPPRVPPGT
jgi:hypothetical protein